MPLGAKILLGLFCSLLLMWADLFGHVTVIGRYGQQLFNQLFAPSVYGKAGEGSRRWTTVVLLGARDLAELGWSWPISYGDHAGILGEIRKLRPQALLIDFLFIDERPDPTLDELLQELEAYDRDRIPVFLGEAPGAGGEPRVRSGLDDAPVRRVPIPGLVADSGYPLTDGAHPTAAAAMYGAICNGPDRPARCRAPVLEIDGRAGGHPLRRLELFWGAKPDPVTARERTCTAMPRRFATRLWRLFRLGSDAYRLDCPFTPTVPAARLLLEPYPDLEGLIRDRAVFYGASLLGTQDVVHPPAHGPLAGVYAHAMAFDNLLTFGRHYKRDEVSVAWGFQLTPYRFRVLVVLIVQGAMLWPFLRFEAWLAGRRGLAAGWRRLLRLASVAGYAVAATAVVLTLAVEVEFRRLDLMPGDWLEAVLEVVGGKELAEVFAPGLGTLVQRLRRPRRRRMPQGGA